ncbi:MULTISPECIES: hypothetical protein [Limnospira]|nr:MULTISPECIES: hypothetical protein [unclassified Limnospira]MDT9276779.1 hypothetical protein [Limnospira sp. PMC 737.11]MDT9292075.1 hypothetical protein [Limnospira sp. PMC 1295.21]MDY7050991.1 hypothetical protein [Limnospira fusiformis LS22]
MRTSTQLTVLGFTEFHPTYYSTQLTVLGFTEFHPTYYYII